MKSGERQQSDELPGEIPLFPLGGVLLLPRGQLPLNIFEPRYIAMVDDVLREPSRLIGMVQTRDDGSLYTVGCAGRITSYNETADGRYEIVLTGLCRFRIDDELAQRNGYRRGAAAWDEFTHDMDRLDCLGMDRDRLKTLLKNYFEKQGLTCSWEAVDLAADDRLMTTLAMVCPFDSKEKQALLEAPCGKERAKLFMTLLEMECRGDCGCKH
ncbi:MAG: LON peptidase substrate-binding domain-containing protein [Micavibrio sp.]